MGIDPGFNVATARDEFIGGMAACAFCLVALFVLTFLIAWMLRRHSVVDVVWGLGFVVVGVISFLSSVDFGSAPRRALLLAMVTIWGVRLAIHIGRRNAGHGEDPRYEQMLAKVRPERRALYAVVTIYLPQVILIFFISMPVQAGSHAHGDVGLLTVFGVAVWAIGLFFEAVGDWQLQAFKSDPANKGTIMDRGLWRYTRHPN
ncbi:MAG TPA: DUF1295 domain-containing protein, partial [Sporichthyaceae bacterium]